MIILIISYIVILISHRSANAFYVDKSGSIFKRLVSQGRQKVSLCGNGLRAFFVFFSKIVNLNVTQLLIDLAKMYGLANQYLCCIQMLLNIEKSGEQD